MIMKRLTFSNPAVNYDNCGLWQGKEKKRKEKKRKEKKRKEKKIK